MFLKNKNLIRLFLFSFLFLCIAGRVYSASIYTKLSQVNVTVGNIFNVQVLVDTEGKIINNSDSIIQFPTDLLDVISIDSNSSIFSMWVEQPNFSNNAGQITFNGGVPNPGFQGKNGKIISIIFKAKKVGTASIVFSSSAVRENDGLGTDILTSKIGTNINISDIIKSTVPPETKPETSSSNVAQNIAPVVTSSSHSKQDTWYNKNNIELSWIMPMNASAVKTLIGIHPDSNTNVYYGTPISSKSIKNIEDGVWYFHVNYLADGTWSKVAHFKLQIDTVSPKNLAVNTTKDDSGKVTLSMKAEDSLSGLDYYKVLVDKDEPINVKSDSNGEASTIVPFSSAGEHTLAITAYDKAGNKTEAITNVTTDFVSTLSIDSYPSKIKINNNIELSGTAPYPYVSLSVSMKGSDNMVESYKIKSDSYSKFNLITKPITKAGNYTIWVDVLKDSGEISFSSERVFVQVEKPLFLTIGSYTTELLSVLVPALIMILIFFFLIYYGWHKFFSLRSHMKKDFKQTEERIHNSFNVLYIEASKQLDILERSKKNRKITFEEEKAIEDMKSAILQMDTYIEKQIQKIEEDTL